MGGMILTFPTLVKLFGPLPDDVVALPEVMGLPEEARIDELSRLLEDWQDEEYDENGVWV